MGDELIRPCGEAVLSHTRRLVKNGKMSDPHAQALRVSAAGAGLDPQAMAEALSS